MLWEKLLTSKPLHRYIPTCSTGGVHCNVSLYQHLFLCLRFHILHLFSFVIFRENLHLLEEGQGLQREELDECIAREEFRRPRESLLNICTEFYKHCGPRLKILQNLAGEPRVISLELLDVKSHMRYYFKST